VEVLPDRRIAVIPPGEDPSISLQPHAGGIRSQRTDAVIAGGNEQERRSKAIRPKSGSGIKNPSTAPGEKTANAGMTSTPSVTAPGSALQKKEPVRNREVSSLDELPPSVRREIPEMSITGDTYSSAPRERTVNINNRLLQEGDYLVAGLKVERIGQRGVIFSYKNYYFRKSF
jgi:hypothetical protein